MKKMLSALCFFIAASGYAQTNSSGIQFKNPVSVATPRGYSQAVSVDLGNYKMIIISGQVAFDKQGNLIGKDDMEKQTEQVFMNIRSIVEDLGGNINQVVKLGYFVTDVTKIQSIRNIRDKFINLQNPPASTLVQVSKLFRDDVLIEIEAIAMIPKN